MKVKQRLPAIIVDIDGTIADNSHRQHYLEGAKKDWDGFFSKLHLDTPRDAVATAARFFWIHKLWTPIFVTGRGAEYREPTSDWLAKHFMWSCNMPLYMRAKGDRRPDVEVKREIYERDIAPIYEVRLVLDDRDSVVKMWRSLGLECWQVAEGSF